MQKNMDTNVKWKVASYARLSREDGDKEESESIRGQRNMIAHFVQEKEDMHIVDEYEDDGFSGVNFERPAFQRLLSDIQNGRINCVIVKDE